LRKLTAQTLILGGVFGRNLQCIRGLPDLFQYLASSDSITFGRVVAEEPFVILQVGIYRVGPAAKTLMSHKHFSRFSLVLFGASISFAQVTLNTIPSRILGHPTAEGFNVTNFNPNLVEGREFYAPAGLAIDTNLTPPVIYVSDSGNNRVLAWKNPSSFINAAPADLVIGQPDMFTTIPSGPGSTFTAGLSAPTGVAVWNSDLYVVDSGNNRVLRFPKPFSNIGQQVPNLIIGQPSLNTRTGNYPSGQPTANGITLVASSNQVYSANIAFDSSGNLWLTDPGNRRVLEFKSSDISTNPATFPAASMVIGQQNLTSLQPNLTSDTKGAYNTTQFYVPEGIAFDSSGRLYVTDGDPSGGSPGQRVLVFNLTTSKTMIIGLPPQSGATPGQAILSRMLLNDASSVFFLPNDQGIGVVDKGHNRVLIFPPYDQWTDPLVAPPAVSVAGQNGDFTNGSPNNAPAGATYVPPATAGTMALPVASLLWNNELYLADTGNNRVIVLPLQGTTLGAGTRVLGQDRLNTNSINLIEGREFEFSPDTGLAVDSTGAIPHLYVADTGNHRVLGFKDLRSVNAGGKADIVIGQPDMQTAICNYNPMTSSGGDPNQPNQTSLCGPVGLAVDAQGNLYVADSLNGRVLRFPTPFSFQGTLEPADLVLGQRDFTSRFTDPSQFSMKNPYGVAFAPSGLLVSDISDNRVLYFSTTSAPLSIGESATKVYGQAQFNTIASGTDQASLAQPRHISADTDGIVYVVDSGNNRVQIFTDPNSALTPTTGAQATLTITDNLNSPRGVYVSPITGQIWVTDTNNNRVKQYPRFDQLQLNPAAATTIPAAAPTLALTQDQYGDLFVADFSHRVAIYFPALQTLNGANFLPDKPLAPGVVASICGPGSNCTTGAAPFNTPTLHAVNLPNPFPLPTQLGDIQVLFNGTPTPIYDVSASQINFVVPMGKQAGDIPTSGFATIQVVKVSTGQILAAGSVPMAVASPGIIELQYTGTQRQAAVLNQDNSVNGPHNPAARGSVIQIYATGQGFTPGAPADGSQPQSAVSTPVLPIVAIGACRVDDPAPPCNGSSSNLVYSGLNSFPGGWQINVRIPQSVAPGSQVPLAISINGATNTDLSFRMTIAVN
jgi:uncharacterized protein (TIGR03437 family)